MLQLANTRFGHSFHREVATGYTIHTEGVALAYIMESGKAKVRPSTGAANERFAGLSLSRNAQSRRLTEVLNIQVPATSPYTVTLPHEPNPGELRVGALTLADPDAGGLVDGTYEISGKTLTFNAAQAGAIIEVGLAFTPSILESIVAAGNDPVGGLPSVGLGVVGVIIAGDAYTDQYDVTADWTGNGVDPVAVYLGANGLFTTKDTGTLLESVTVLQTPSAGAAFLGLSIRSAS